MNAAEILENIQKELPRMFKAIDTDGGPIKEFQNRNITQSKRMKNVHLPKQKV